MRGWPSGRMVVLLDVLETELLGFLIVAEQFRVTTPGDDGSQRVVGVIGDM